MRVGGHRPDTSAVYNPNPRGDPRHRQGVTEREKLRAAVLQEEFRLTFSQLTRGWKRNVSGSNRAEEEQGVGTCVLKPDHDPRARLQTFRLQRRSEAQDGVLERGKGPDLRWRRQRVREDEQGRFVRILGGRAAYHVGGHVEASRGQRSAKAKCALLFAHGASPACHHVSKSVPKRAVRSGGRKWDQWAIHCFGMWNRGMT